MWVRNLARPYDEPLDTPFAVSLLANAAATGGGQQVTGGTYNWQTSGAFDGATAQLQWSADNGLTWIDVAGASATTPSSVVDLMLSAGLVRVLISAAGAGTLISSNLSAVSCC